MSTSPQPHLITVEEYLEQEAKTEIKHEYIDGVVYAMSGGTEQHSLIITNTMIALGMQIRDQPCRIYNSDMRVKISDTRFVYPDFSVVCGDPVFADENRTMLTNPVLVAEVMSKSSADYDRGSKGEYYRSLPSLEAYLLLDQNRVYAQLYTRYETGWLLRDFHGKSVTIPLEILHAHLAMSEIYRNVELSKQG